MMIPDNPHIYQQLSYCATKPSNPADSLYPEDIDPEDYFNSLLFEGDLDENYSLNLDVNGFFSGFDEFLDNPHEEPVQEKLNAAAIEATAFKSQSALSTELLPVVNPNEVFPHQTLKKKIRVTSDVQLNNARKNGCDVEFVHVDHCYVAIFGKKVEIKQEVMIEEEEEEVESEQVAVKVEPLVVKPLIFKRPVGRPRKTPIVTKPVKRPAVTNFEEEIVDVESIDVKRPRKTPKAKPSPAPTKKAPIKPYISKSKALSKPSTSGKGRTISLFQAIDPFNPNGYVMRQAKTSAIKKITKANNKSPAVSRSKRSDHNDMEKKRRDEMRDLFGKLKVLVPMEMLKDDNNKMKKNPSKNNVLVGSSKYITHLTSRNSERNSLTEDNQRLQKKWRRLAKSLNKQCKRLMLR